MRLQLLFLISILITTVSILTYFFYPWPTSNTNSPQAIEGTGKLITKNASFQDPEELSPSRINSAYVSFLGSALPHSATSVHKLTLHYEIQASDGSHVPASALVFVPAGEFTSMPILVYGPGTTGLANRCAPSNEDPQKPTLGNYENQMISYAAQGMVVIMPNYLGFDTNHQLQYYYIARKEAVSMLSSVKAFSQAELPLVQQLSINLDQVFLAGYSQGGHSAFAAADYHQELAPDISISGIIGHGPTPDVVKVLQQNPNLAPYITSAYEKYYDDFDPSNIINQSYLDSIDEAEKICADEGFGYRSVTADQTYQPDFLSALNTGSVNEAVPNEGKRFEENKVGVVFTNIPVFLAQGTTDPIVTLRDQTQFVEQLCQRQVPVEYQQYPNQHHFYIRQASFTDTQEWITQVVSGSTPSNCS